MTVDKKKQDELIMKYAPLVKNIVGRMASKLPIDVSDREDLLNVGIIGLMSALEKFDKTRNVQFETYASFRIRGAVLDELRARDWVPRSTRSKDNKLEEAFRCLQKELGRSPDEEEMARHFGISLEEYFKLLDESRCVSIISSEDLPHDYFDNHGQVEIMEKIDSGNPLDLLANRELKAKLKEAVDDLPEKEKLVLSLYYYEELTMKEIGRVMDLTESRVCQIHSQATLRLRSVVKNLV